MSQTEVFDAIVEILKPYARSEGALAQISPETDILMDLRVNSARIVDVVLALEDRFGMAFSDEDMDEVVTVGDAVRLVSKALQ